MDEENCQTLFLNSALTSIYIPTILVTLNYFGKLYDLGKQATYIEWVLLGAELIKYLLCHHTSQKIGNKQRKTSRKIDIKHIFEGIMVLVSMLATFYFGAVIFGAPVSSQHYETFYFALIMTILTALPCVLHLNIENVPILFLSLFEGTDLHTDYFWNIRLTIFGSWLGAVVIPLDWNKPYQIWPIPCCIGGLCGYYLGNVCALLRKRFAKKKTSRFNLCK